MFLLSNDLLFRFFLLLPLDFCKVMLYILIPLQLNYKILLI